LITTTSLARENLVAVVCPDPGTPEQLKYACTRIDAANRRALCEVTSVAQAEAALDAGSDGLIAVGHEAGRPVRIPLSFSSSSPTARKSPPRPTASSA